MGIIYPPYWKKLFWKESSEAKNDVIFHLNISNSLLAKREFQIQSVRVVIGLLRNFQESRKFPFPNCFTSNRASNFFGNFGEISESFLKSEWVGTFLVFSRKFPRKWMSRYVPPRFHHSIIENYIEYWVLFKKLNNTMCSFVILGNFMPF